MHKVILEDSRDYSFTHGLQLLWPSPGLWRVDAREAMWAVNLKIHACQTPQQDEKITRGLEREETEWLLF